MNESYISTLKSETLTIGNIIRVGAVAIAFVDFPISNAQAYAQLPSYQNHDSKIIQSEPEFGANVDLYKNSIVYLDKLHPFFNAQAVLHKDKRGIADARESKVIITPEQEAVNARITKMVRNATTELAINPSGNNNHQTMRNIGHLSVDFKHSYGQRTIIVFKQSKKFHGKIDGAVATLDDGYFDKSGDFHQDTSIAFNPRKNGRYIVHQALNNLSAFDVFVSEALGFASFGITLVVGNLFSRISKILLT